MSLIPCPVGLLDHSDVKLPQHEFDCFCKVCVLFRNVWFCQKMISIHQTKPLPNNLYNATTEFMKQAPTVKQVRKPCIDTLTQNEMDNQSTLGCAKVFSSCIAQDLPRSALYRSMLKGVPALSASFAQVTVSGHSTVLHEIH